MESPDLFFHCHCGDVDKAKEVLKGDAFDVNRRDSSGKTALHLATARGHAPCVQLLLENGASVNAADKAGNTALHHCGHAEALTLLVKYGGDLRKGNNHGCTPLEMARRRGVSTEVLQLFIELQKDVITTRNTSQNSKTGFNRQLSDSHIGSILSEFFGEVGIVAVLCVILIVVFLSMGVAWVLTGLSSESNRKIPIDGYEQIQHIEL